MHFVDRKAKYPGRWTMMKSDGTSEIITLIRNDEPVVEGTPMNADTLNTLSDVAGADIAKEKAEAAATVASTAKGAAELAANSATASRDAAASSAEEAKKSADKAAAVVSTDPTLTVSGAPADAKATGDRIKAIKIVTDKTLTVANAAALEDALCEQDELTGTRMSEIEDAMCEQDEMNDERMSAIEDAVCELDAAVNK